jgi:hypothetical protein
VAKLTSRPNISTGGSAGSWAWEGSSAALLVAGCVASMMLGTGTRLLGMTRNSAVLLYFEYVVVQEQLICNQDKNRGVERRVNSKPQKASID